MAEAWAVAVAVTEMRDTVVTHGAGYEYEAAAVVQLVLSAEGSLAGGT